MLVMRMPSTCVRCTSSVMRSLLCPLRCTPYCSKSRFSMRATSTASSLHPLPGLLLPCVLLHALPLGLLLPSLLPLGLLPKLPVPAAAPQPAACAAAASAA